MTFHRKPTFGVTFELLSRNPQNLPERQKSQSDYFYCLTLSGRLFFPPFSLMKLAWWSWASGYQTNLSLCFVGKLLPYEFGVGKIVLSDKKLVARQLFFWNFRGSGLVLGFLSSKINSWGFGAV